jgi:hypothetical protein
MEQSIGSGYFVFGSIGPRSGSGHLNTETEQYRLQQIGSGAFGGETLVVGNVVVVQGLVVEGSVVGFSEDGFSVMGI